MIAQNFNVEPFGIRKTESPEDFIAKRGKYNKRFVGFGQNRKEALIDALDKIREAGFDTTPIEENNAVKDNYLSDSAENDSVENFVDSKVGQGDLLDTDSFYYFVAVRFDITEEEEVEIAA